MIDWPDELIDDIAKRKSILYLGSGVSANCVNDVGKHPATWEAFLRDILLNKSSELGTADQIIIELIDKNDYLMACEIIINILGNRVFGELAADEFRRPGYHPTELHETIFKLDSKIVITPNIDSIYDQYAMQSSNGTILIKKYTENIAPTLRSPDYLIIKAHGTIDDPNHIVFTHGQYSRARNEYSGFYRILDALMLTHTFIFIGCGISDPDIQLILENSNFSFPHCRPHYMIAANETINPNVRDCLIQNRNLQFLTYDNTDGTHSQLFEALKILDDLVDIKRQEIASNISW
ncbi:MAG: SIR2 family protein [Anaerofustis sp.]